MIVGDDGFNALGAVTRDRPVVTRSGSPRLESPAVGWGFAQWRTSAADRAARPAREAVPVRERRFDIVFMAFFIVNFAFITYIWDFECLSISNPYHFRYPMWPPKPFVDLVHWYGRTYDPLLMARPAFWRATMWNDLLLFGPFYACAIYAFAKGKEWIRIPAVLWSGMMLTNLLVILLEEWHGTMRTSHLPFILMLNAPWVLLPIAVLARVGFTAHPFTRPADRTDDTAAS